MAKGMPRGFRDDAKVLPLPRSLLGEQGLQEVPKAPRGHPKMPRGSPCAEHPSCLGFTFES